MTGILLRRSLTLIMTIVLTSIIIFALTQFLPGDVAKLVLGREVSDAEAAAFKVRFGLDQPAMKQYFDWVKGFLQNDWGISYVQGNPQVRPLVLERLGNSLRLAAATLLIAIPGSIVLGVVAALKEDSWIDGLISILSLSVVGLPEFVTGIALLNIFALGFGWFEATSLVNNSMTVLDWIRILILPAVTASFVLIGYVTRMTRAGMIDELRKPYVRTAILKGLPRRTIVFRHVLRNALLPTITVIAISIGWLMGGLVVIENVFNYPGLGSELVSAVERQNIPVLQAITMIIVTVFALANLVADLLYVLLNPRIRLE